MTVSFHKYGEYFPGTGELRDIGVAKGKNYAVNFPLRDGIDDESYAQIFQPVIQHVMDWYRPSAIVLQCGSDSLAGDKLGCFNLSMKGHAECVRFVKSFSLPTLVLGGGGYTMRNVARTWAYETAILVNQNIGPDLPYNDYFDYFGPDYKLDVPANNMENLNSKEYLEKMKVQVLQNIERSGGAPSVQMQDVPRDMPSEDEDEEDDDEGARKAAEAAGDDDGEAAMKDELHRREGVRIKTLYSLGGDETIGVTEPATPTISVEPPAGGEELAEERAKEVISDARLSSETPSRDAAPEEMEER